MAELLFTSEAFQPQGLPTANVPMLLDAEMRLIEPACAWLLHVALVRGRTRSKETWRTYGEALYDWWQTLEANGWIWDKVGSNELAAYRTRMLEVTSDHTGRPYARATINVRLRVLAMFYRWCAASGLVGEVPFSISDLSLGRSRPAPFLAHIDAKGGRQSVNELTVRHTRSPPRPLEPATIRRAMEGMEARDRLIVEWAVTTGVRRLEIAGLRITMLPDTASAQMPVMPIRLNATKGGKVRQIYPPLPLIDRTRAYVREERAVVVRRTRERDQSYREPDALFLTEHGDPMTPRRIGAMFARACKMASVKATFHELRHTFAGAMLRFLQRQLNRTPELNPLLALQSILGHADLATTGIYLRMLAQDLSAVETTVDELYKELGL
jgi:site-specific recombinase XerD